MKLHRISANETELHRGNDVVFFSYDTPVAFFQSGAGYFRTDTHFSPTTSKHINRWLAGMKAQVVSQEKIETFLG
jgi:hypothetical protein